MDRPTCRPRAESGDESDSPPHRPALTPRFQTMIPQAKGNLVVFGGPTMTIRSSGSRLSPD
jgi:hypothetical protein